MNVVNPAVSETPPPPALGTPTRVRYGVLGFACALSMITYLDRVCFGTVAIFIRREFGLTPDQLGYLFGAFTLAYATFEVPSGWLGDVFGPRKTLIRIVLWWSFFTALTGMIYPSASWPSFAFLAMLLVRFFFGIGEAGAYPNIARAFHNWFPFQERGFAKGTVWMAGRFAGGVTPFIVLALISEGTVDGQPIASWRHTFWIFGGLGVVWCVLFWIWFRDRPEEKAGVNAAEVALIHAGEPHQGSASLRVPWGQLMRSGNLWLLCGMYFCASYGWYFNITYLPGFLEEQFGLERGTEKWTREWLQFSLMAGLPLLFGSLACLLGGLMTDSFIKRTGNRMWGRRLFGVLGHGLCAVCYSAALVVMHLTPGHDRTVMGWLFVLAIASASFWNDITMGSAWASCLDIGGRYSGIVAGCMNTVGNLGGFAANILTGWVLTLALPAGAQHGTDEYRAGLTQGWTVNFLVFAGVYVLAVLLWFRFDATKPVACEVPVEPPAL